MTQVITQTPSPFVNLMSEATMTSKEIAELVGSRHDSVKRTIERLVEKGIIDQPPTVDGEKSANKVVEKHYMFKGETGRLDSITVVAQLSPAFTKALVLRWDELEKKNHLRTPTNYIEALEALIVSEKEKALIADERDYAIATKAEIGTRREATAMATASKEKRRAEKLEIELDQSKNYATIKRMQILYQGLSFNWRELKSISKELGLPPIDVFDQNYGTVKAYHRDVWQEAYALDF